MKRLLWIPFCLLYCAANAQNDRVNDFNNTNWLQSFNTIRLNKKWSLHLEYQWRREDGLKHWQQGLLRTGVNYKLNDAVTVHAGYAWAATHPYGDYPIASNGTFPEHRVYEQLNIRQPVSKWLLLHRFRAEQRWIGRVKAGTDGTIEGWNFLHRFRYQFRVQRPFWSKKDRQFYGAAADEILIGAGKKVGVNIFDQNRIFLLVGYTFSKRFTLEGGYFNQTLQQGRRISNQTIMQRNNGCVLASYLNF